MASPLPQEKILKTHLFSKVYPIRKNIGLKKVLSSVVGGIVSRRRPL
jgi:hypothetical protein